MMVLIKLNASNHLRMQTVANCKSMTLRPIPMMTLRPQYIYKTTRSDLASFGRCLHPAQSILERGHEHCGGPVRQRLWPRRARRRLHIQLPSSRAALQGEPRLRRIRTSEGEATTVHSPARHNEDNSLSPGRISPAGPGPWRCPGDGRRCRKDWSHLRGQQGSDLRRHANVGVPPHLLLAERGVNIYFGLICFA